MFILSFFKSILNFIILLIIHRNRINGVGIRIKKTSFEGSGIVLHSFVNCVNCRINSSVSIFSNTTISNSWLNGNNKIGKFCTIENSEIGKYTYITDGAVVLNLKIGKYCSIGPGLNLGLASHPVNRISTSPIFYSNTKFLGVNITDKYNYSEFKQTNIGNDVWVGANVFIKSGVHIANGVVIAAGSVVTKDIEPYAIVGGNPAKVIRYRFPKEIIELLQQSEWWNKSYDTIKECVVYFQQDELNYDTLNQFLNKLNR